MSRQGGSQDPELHQRTYDITDDNDLEMQSRSTSAQSDENRHGKLSSKVPSKSDATFQDAESEPFLQQSSTDISKPIFTPMKPDPDQDHKTHASHDGSWRLLTGWQMCVSVSCVCTLLVLVCNVGLLAWAQTHPLTAANTRVIWKGDCGRSKRVATWSHLGINISSTVILASSNYAMQILVAPTREDVDRAHSQDR